MIHMGEEKRLEQEPRLPGYSKYANATTELNVLADDSCVNVWFQKQERVLKERTDYQEKVVSSLYIRQKDPVTLVNDENANPVLDTDIGSYIQITR